MQRNESMYHPLQKWQEAIWLLIALLIPLFVNFWVEQQFEASKVWLLRTLVWALAVLWLAGWLVGLRPKPLPSPIRMLVIILALILALSTLFSANQAIAIYGTLDRANGVLTQLTYLLLFWCVATRINPERSRQLLSVITLTAIPVCLLGLAQAAGWQPLPVSSDARSLITSTLGRANFSGAYLALLLPLTLSIIRTATGSWRRFGYGILFGLEIMVIALTQARAAWIASVVGISVFLWLQHAPRWSRRVRWLSGLGGVAVLTGALSLILQRGIANGDSIAARWTIWQASLRLLWPELLLGYGADTLELYFPSVYPPQLVYYLGRGVSVDRAHNWVLDWSLNYGIVAAIVYLALVTLILWAGWKRLTTPQIAIPSQADEKPLENHWLMACMAGICAQLVGNLFLFEVAATTVVFWLLLAIVVAATTGSNTQPTRPSLPMWIRNGVIVFSVVFVGWAVWQSNVQPLLADLHSWRGTTALNQGKPVAALAEYETAIKHQPQRAAYHVAAALTAAQLSRFGQAERAMLEAIALRPTDPLLHTQLAAVYAGEALETPGKLEMAYEAYERGHRPG